MMRYLALLLLAGCTYLPPSPPVPPAPPGPDPVEPHSGLAREVFTPIEVGAPESVLDTLPAPDKDVTVSDLGIRIRAWRLGDGTWWEVHTKDGAVAGTFNW